MDLLPVELFPTILSHVPEQDLQRAWIGLYHIFPGDAFPLRILFMHVRISHKDQLIQFYQRLRSKALDDPRLWVQSFSLDAWDADVEILINVLKQLTNIHSLRLNVGPTNFSPDHLKEIFELRRFTHVQPLDLEVIGVRFKPYLTRVNHLPFLQGSYYDSALLALSRLPSHDLPCLSIVQDTIDHETPAFHKFAQPLVFHAMDSTMPVLLSSEFASTLTSLRFCIPTRRVARAITDHPLSAPRLEVLDLSTCLIKDMDVETILARYVRLNHLLVDQCDCGDGTWAQLAKQCATIGVKRAKDREKKLKQWIQTATPGVAQEEFRKVKKPKKGRSGLSTAPISIRQLTLPTVAPSAPPPPTNSTLREEKFRILPPFPSLQTFCTTTVDRTTQVAAIQAEWNLGWSQGIEQLSKHRARLAASSKNGVRIFKFTDDVEDIDYEDPTEWLGEGLAGLEDVIPQTDEWEDIDPEVLVAPILCLAGQDLHSTDHSVGCGHKIATTRFRT